MSKQDLLIEIGTEELPPKSLPGLSAALEDGFRKALEAAGLGFDGLQRFATPRRLALRVDGLATRQPDSRVERFGPAVKAAYDDAGNPTKAAQGFARSCGVELAELSEKSDGKVTKLYYEATRAGEQTATLLPDMLDSTLAGLPIPRRMRWGSSRAEFIRPVHWIVLLFGDAVVETTLLGIPSGRETRGHRFHHPDALHLDRPADYPRVLAERGYVIADFQVRREQIRAQLLEIGTQRNATVVIDDALLDEVCALVEWPVALTGDFDPSFLDVPQEALVSSMQGHQKCFHMVDEAGRILPHFITISNLESRDPAQVIAGNERVIGPRLADAAFFYNQDRKRPLADRRPQLDEVIFQQTLGSLGDKSARVADLAATLCEALGGDATLVSRAALLSRCDLLTSMVYEFPELQGIMGTYYAREDGEPTEVAEALREQYLPRFAGDELPATLTGTLLALAERLDTIAGLFSIGQPPTGSKDPFALRRAALGILRILVEKQLDLDLKAAVAAACAAQPGEFDRPAVTAEVLDFIFDRFRAWYQDRDIRSDIFQAVDAVRPASPWDFDRRVHAVSRFSELPEAASLAAANKRVSNILSSVDLPPELSSERSRLTEAAEIALADAIEQQRSVFDSHFAQRQYTEALAALASLQAPVDAFFDQVMVNTEDADLRRNRQALLQELRGLFLRIADVSLLQTTGS